MSVRRRGFSLLEVLVVVLLVGALFGFIGFALRGSSQSASRAERVDVTRLARQITRRLEDDLRMATVLAAPAYGEASLTMVLWDDRHHRVQYFNRDAAGKDLFTLEEAALAAASGGVSLVRIEDTGTEKIQLVRRDPNLKHVLFRRLGTGLMGVELQFDHEKVGLPSPERARSSCMVALARQAP